MVGGYPSQIIHNTDASTAHSGAEALEVSSGLLRVTPVHMQQINHVGRFNVV
jgi:hypothetical protein